ncbi:MAG: hypothetical protein NZ480_08495 [Bdellovibrionaceae bacterium]|nr:hypothetical protein [Pseudobdellovibrionaceae bacterium]MDW8189713.1 hypothetical protein [Pseudobdellovibrionaceae bacterium]
MVNLGKSITGIFFATTTISLITFAADHSSNQAEGNRHNNMEKPYFKLFTSKEATGPHLSKLPEKPQIILPVAFSKIPEGQEVLLKWHQIPGATAYHLQIASDPQFKWIIQEVYSLTETEFRIRNLSAGTVFWRVAAVNSQNLPGYTKSPFAFSSFEVTSR